MNEPQKRFADRTVEALVASGLSWGSVLQQEHDHPEFWIYANDDLTKKHVAFYLGDIFEAFGLPRTDEAWESSVERERGKLIGFDFHGNVRVLRDAHPAVKGWRAPDDILGYADVVARIEDARKERADLGRVHGGANITRQINRVESQLRLLDGSRTVLGLTGRGLTGKHYNHEMNISCSIVDIRRTIKEKEKEQHA